MVITVTIIVSLIVLALSVLIWLIAKENKTRTDRIILRTTSVLLIVLFVFSLCFLGLYIFVTKIAFGGIKTDVSRRLMSPDWTKTALLIRRQAFDLNFIVEVNNKELFFSRDYVPIPTVNWNENINWSADSSFLVLTIHDPDADEPFEWAYDFKEQKEITDSNLIKSIWIDRNKGDEKQKTIFPPKAD